MTEPQTIYLLGAGASRDTELPALMGLIQRIGELIQADEPLRPSSYGYGPSVGLLTQTHYAAIVNIQVGDVYKGRLPDEVDIEKFFVIIQMLTATPELKTAPFTQQWREPFLSRSDMLKWSWFIEETSRYFGSIREGWQETFGNSGLPVPPASETHRKLYKAVHGKLGSAPTPENKTVHDYLTGPSRSRSIRVVTLNYDIGIENASVNAGLLVDIGVERWRGRMPWERDENADARLLESHGPIDWGRPYGVEEYPPEDEPRMVWTQLRKE